MPISSEAAKSAGHEGHPEFSKTDRAYVTVDKNEFHNTRELIFKFYNATSGRDATDRSFFLGSGSRQDRADGKESWKTVFKPDSLLWEQRFDRKGSPTGPDLVQTQKLELSLEDEVLSLHHRWTEGRGSAGSGSCELVSLKHDEAEAQFWPIAKITEIKLPASAASGAKAAMESFLSVAEGQENDASYKGLFKYVKTLENFLKTGIQGLRVFQIQWRDSENGGGGLFFLDPANNEAVYLGTSYHG